MRKATSKQIWMHDKLRPFLDTFYYNAKFKGFDFVIIITGSGMLRVGKSLLGQQIGFYLAELFGTPFGIKNIFFGSEDLISHAHAFPKNSVLIYDEARETMATKKIYEEQSKRLEDFFAECGAYNHVYILILPNFFDLVKGMAVTRSEFLINVLRPSEKKLVVINGEQVPIIELKRGYYDIYNRKKKKLLYEIGRRRYEDYSIGKKFRLGYGEFRNQWIIDESEYMKKKLEFMKRDREKPEQKNRYIVQRDQLIRILKKKTGMNYADLSRDLKKEGFSISDVQISRIAQDGSA